MAQRPLKPSYDRSRSRGQFYPSSNQNWSWYNVPGPAPVWSQAAKANSRGTVESMTDRVTPGYKTISSQGGIVNNWCSRIREDRSTTTSGPMFANSVSDPGTVHYGDLQGPHWTQGTPQSVTRPAGRPSFSVDMQNLRSLAATQAMANVDKPDFNGAVTIGEIGETLRYLRNPVAAGLQLADRIAKSARQSGLTKGASRRARLNPKPGGVGSALAGVHLSIIYGFKPLVKDIFAALTTLQNASHLRPPRQTARGKQERTYTDTWTSQETFSGITYTATYKWEQVVTVKCGVFYSQSVEVSGFDHFGLRIKDIPAAMWAISPLSFVTDWFVNVGTFISAITPSAGTKILAAWTTTTTKTTLTRSVSNYVLPLSGWTTARQGSGTDTCVRTEVTREPFIDAPSLAMVDIAGLKNDVSRLSSMISLLSTRLGSIKTHQVSPPNVRVTGRPQQLGAWSN